MKKGLPLQPQTRGIYYQMLANSGSLDFFEKSSPKIW